MIKSEDVYRELEKIRKKCGGVLKAEAVVTAAKNPNNPLHDRFEWDDTEAATRWRLRQARELIRVSGQVIEGDSEPIQAYVSLKSDQRIRDGGMFRPMVEVLQDDDLSEQLLADAKEDMLAFTRKYRKLKKLKDVIAAMEGVL